MNAADNLPNLYESKYNFISLPRAVRLLRTYGSARNIQEGGMDGEGIVKMLRPLPPRGLKAHFARNLINAFHRDQQLGELCAEVGSQLTAVDQNTTQQNIVIQDMINKVEQDLDASEDAMESSVAPDLEDESETLGTLYSRVNNVTTINDTVEDDEEEDQETFCSFVADGQQFKKYRYVHSWWSIACLVCHCRSSSLC
jgi:hypothetical protein